MSRSPRRPARARKRSRRSSHRSPKRGSWPSRRRKRFRGVKRTIMENNNTWVMSFEEPLEYSLGEEVKTWNGQKWKVHRIDFQSKEVTFRRESDLGDDMETDERQGLGNRLTARRNSLFEPILPADKESESSEESGLWVRSPGRMNKKPRENY